MRNSTKLALGSAVAALLMSLAGAGLAQDKPAAPAKPATAQKPAEGGAKPAEGGAKPAEAAAAPAGAKPAAPPAAAGGAKPADPAPGLKVGEYACTGGGANFKVTAAGAYTNLTGGQPGTYVVTGNTITFAGGVLNGQPGRDLKDNKFTIGTSATCALKV
jgi:hypothetical protein